MLKRLRFMKRLIVDLPRQARLAYCLLRDPRVPLHTRVLFGAGMGLIVTPFVDLPAAIPFVGELDVVALSMLALRLFIAACPDDIVADVGQQILEGRSVFDEDLRNGERIATLVARHFQHESGTVHDGTAVPHEPASGVGA